MAILNVTPAEFQLMQEMAARDRLDRTDSLATWCQGAFGCDLCTPYAIKIWWNVPAIPWLSQGLQRIEEGGSHATQK